MYYIGIDLGTSSLKLMLVDDKGKVIKEVSREYPLEFPKPCWSQQSPEDWWKAINEGMPELIKGVTREEIVGIGCGGQMHGLVILDKNDHVIRPAILWNDSRTEKEVDYLNNVIGKDNLSRMTANIAFAGFTAPKLFWLKENEPENFAKIEKIMLPKDYVNYCLTGVHSCDYSDASGMLLLDVKNKCWSDEMLKICEVRKEQMPRLFESFECIGTVKKDVANSIGLSENVKVVAGAGDNAAAAVGTAVVGNGNCNISLGTSGTIFISSDDFRVDPKNGLHAFCHADGGYHLMGCILSAASCNKWFYEQILKSEDYKGLQDSINKERLGKNQIYFLPYLMGERSPINDTSARSTFIGMTMDTDRRDMIQAVMEGVSFAIRDNFEVAKELKIEISSSMICGGGSKSTLWCHMLSDILGIPLNRPVTEQGPGYGGAMLAMVGCGLYKSVQEAADDLIKIKETIDPNPELSKLYEEQYRKFRQIYPAMKQLFATLTA